MVRRLVRFQLQGRLFLSRSRDGANAVNRKEHGRLLPCSVGFWHAYVCFIAITLKSYHYQIALTQSRRNCDGVTWSNCAVRQLKLSLCRNPTSRKVLKQSKYSTHKSRRCDRCTKWEDTVRGKNCCGWHTAKVLANNRSSRPYLLCKRALVLSIETLFSAVSQCTIVTAVYRAQSVRKALLILIICVRAPENKLKFSL